MGNHPILQKTATKVSYSKISKELFYKILLSNPHSTRPFKETAYRPVMKLEKKVQVSFILKQNSRRIKTVPFGANYNRESNFKFTLKKLFYT